AFLSPGRFAAWAQGQLRFACCERGRDASLPEGSFALLVLESASDSVPEAKRGVGVVIRVSQPRRCSMTFIPPFCPNRHCPTHLESEPLPKGWFIRKGFRTTKV